MECGSTRHHQLTGMASLMEFMLTTLLAWHQQLYGLPSKMGTGGTLATTC